MGTRRVSHPRHRVCPDLGCRCWLLMTLGGALERHTSSCGCTCSYGAHGLVGDVGRPVPHIQPPCAIPLTAPPGQVDGGGHPNPGPPKDCLRCSGAPRSVIRTPSGFASPEGLLTLLRGAPECHTDSGWSPEGLLTPLRGTPECHTDSFGNRWSPEGLLTPLRGAPECHTDSFGSRWSPEGLLKPLRGTPECHTDSFGTR